MHCPQSGLTIRSLSHHLAVVLGDEIKPIWNQWPALEVDSHLNLLVIPRPSVVNPQQFRARAPIKDEMSNIDPDYFGFFCFDHLDSCKPTIAEILRLVEVAKRASGTIHGLYFLSWRCLARNMNLSETSLNGKTSFSSPELEPQELQHGTRKTRYESVFHCTKPQCSANITGGN